MMRKGVLVGAIAMIVCCVAVAATQWVDIEKRLTPEQMRATGLDTLKPEQLELLNRLLRNDVEAARAEERAAVESAAAAQPTARKEGAAREGLFGFDDGPIVTRLVGTLTGWEPGTEFELANGQRWKVLKGHYTFRKPLESPEVKIVPGAAGRWFFRVDEDTPGARVYRID